LITVFYDAPEENKESKKRVYRATRNDYIFEPSGTRSSPMRRQTTITVV